jgi:hypothetical protein
VRNTDWMAHALCGTRPDLPWTLPDTDQHRRICDPPAATQARMTAICHTCPVRPDCATWALHGCCQGGMYAGVWIPASRWGHHTAHWHDARRRLTQLAKPVHA